MIELRGKNALVCGSTQGIGKATALLFAKQGARVTLLARNEDMLKKTLEELPPVSAGGHTYLCADFNHPAGLKDVLGKHIAAGNSFHILVNNSGGPPGGEILKAQEEEFITAFQRHLICNQILVQHLAPGMKNENYGRIINIISTSVKEPIRGLGVSNTIRAAVANWAKTMSVELAPFGITVNNVLPGSTETVRISEIIAATALKSGKSKEQVRADMVGKVPAGRFAAASEIAAAVAFLASPDAAYINGINLPVDGGRTACL